MMGCKPSLLQTQAMKDSALELEEEYINTRGPMAIYYGTTSGTSSKISFEFSQEVQRLGFLTSGKIKLINFQLVINLSDFDPTQLSIQTLAVFFVASYGSGGPTGDAEQFFEWIMADQRTNDQLKGLKYIIFGLGNKNYENFCGMGVKTDDRLSFMGAERLYQLGKGNAQEETTLKDLEEWKSNGLWDVLQSQFPIQKIHSEQLMQNQSQLVLEILKENTQSIILSQIKNIESYQFHCQQYLNASVLQVKQISEMKKCASFGNSAIFIDLDATPMVEKNIKYKTAGNIQIYPENDEQSILELCNHFNWDPKMMFDIKSNPYLKHQFKLPFPTPLSVRDYLVKFCDLHGSVNKKQLYELSKLVQSKQDSQKLEYLSSYEGRDEYEEKITNERHSLLTLILQYNIKNIPLLKFIELAYPLRPRFYTISSSAKKYPNNIQIVCSALKVKTPYKEKVQYQKLLLCYQLGVCSQYFQNLLTSSQSNTASYLRVSYIDSFFQFPLDPLCPVILVGPGAGVAPMRAFIQEKDEYIEKDQLDQCPFQGPMTLYYGCRTRDEFIFETELKQYESNGTLSALHLAFSRETQEKVVQIKSSTQFNQIYVTTLLGKDLVGLSNFFDCKGTLYICGSMQMGRDTLSIVENMFKQVKKIAPYMAYRKVAELEKKGQIIKEIWG